MRKGLNSEFSQGTKTENVYEYTKCKSPHFYGLSGWNWAYFRGLVRVVNSSSREFSSIPRKNEPLMEITKEEYESAEVSIYVA